MDATWHRLEFPFFKSGVPVASAGDPEKSGSEHQGVSFLDEGLRIRQAFRPQACEILTDELQILVPRLFAPPTYHMRMGAVFSREFTIWDD